MIFAAAAPAGHALPGALAAKRTKTGAHIAAPALALFCIADSILSKDFSDQLQFKF